MRPRRDGSSLLAQELSNKENAMRCNGRWLPAAALMGLVLLIASGPPAQANILAPGGAVAPDLFGAVVVPPDPNVVASLLSVPWSIGASSGTYDTWVIKNGGGTLDFVIQVSVSASTNPFIPELVTNGPGLPIFGPGTYTGFATDVGYDTTSVGVAPTRVTRSGDGSVIRFEIPGIANGSSTRRLVIETDATYFASSSIGIIDGSGFAGPGFAPTAAPLPASANMGLVLLAGFGGLGAWRKLRFNFRPE